MPSYLLQTVNAELARYLASVQWNLEVEVYEILTLVSAEFGNPIDCCTLLPRDENSYTHYLSHFLGVDIICVIRFHK